MNIFKLFQGNSRYFYLFIVVVGAVNSIVYSGLLYIINSTVSGESIPWIGEKSALAFFSLIALSFLMSRFFQSYMVRITHEFLLRFELAILNRLRSTSLSSFMKIGSERVYTAIADTRILGQVPESFLGALNAAVIALCGIGYLLWISPVGGVTVLLVMSALVCFYLLRNAAIEKNLNTLRDLQNNYHVYLKDLLDGFREIKMSGKRNNRLYEGFIENNRLDAHRLGVNTTSKYVHNELFGSYSWYVLLGLIMFVFPHVAATSGGQVSAFVVTVLYLMGPIATLILFIPFYTRLKISMQRINELEMIIDEDCEVEDQGSNELNNLQELSFKSVSYDYNTSESQEGFVLGPIDLSIKKGEIVFLTGGNGSGKSTFVNLLTGLKRPTAGAISLNGETLMLENYPSYRELISAIFTDPHLFKENYDGFDLTSSNADLQEYLKLMGLEEKISLNEDTESIAPDLSKGQQKRLAMIYTLLEEKDIIVLDEWAAEQDPEYRGYFYTVLLDYLRSKGKTVIAVTHDDRYFGCADRIIKFEFGKVVSDRYVEVDQKIMSYA